METTPAKPGPRKVCVRVVDVFGFEAAFDEKLLNQTCLT